MKDRSETYQGPVIDFDTLFEMSDEIIDAYRASLKANNVDATVVQEAIRRFSFTMMMPGDVENFIFGLTTLFDVLGRNPRDFGVHEGNPRWRMPKEWKKGGERNGNSR